jgi:hypothetical protein
MEAEDLEVEREVTTQDPRACGEALRLPTVVDGAGIRDRTQADQRAPSPGHADPERVWVAGGVPEGHRGSVLDVEPSKPRRPMQRDAGARLA